MDRPLPEALHDYGRLQNVTLYHETYGENLLKRVSKSVSEDDAYAMTRLTNYSDSEREARSSIRDGTFGCL